MGGKPPLLCGALFWINFQILDPFPMLQPQCSVNIWSTSSTLCPSPAQSLQGMASALRKALGGSLCAPPGHWAGCSSLKLTTGCSQGLCLWFLSRLHCLPMQAWRLPCDSGCSSGTTCLPRFLHLVLHPLHACLSVPLPSLLSFQVYLPGVLLFPVSCLHHW